MDNHFCVECLEEAIERYGKPDIFNSDQGAQFTSKAFTDVLIKHDIKISMDGKGRALDNIFVERLWRSVKYEDIYLKGYTTVSELYVGLTNYSDYYNQSRPHQSLNYATPASVYSAAKGGGASIVNKYSMSKTSSPQNSMGQRQPAAGETALSQINSGIGLDCGVHIRLNHLLMYSKGQLARRLMATNTYLAAAPKLHSKMNLFGKMRFQKNLITTPQIPI